MKRILLLSLLSILIAISTTYSQQSNQNDDEWYPFVIPANLAANSPANIGKLILDAPAGKHGFCKVKDGHFYFEDDTRAKFWGTNLGLSSCFPDKKEAIIIANRIAFFGFNAVRIHQLDYYFEPKGIFEDTNPSYKNPHLKNTSKLSKSQLDKLDYFIYQLKNLGIYVDMNLLVSRHFTANDGLIGSKELVEGGKPMSMFDSKLIELQKKYAYALLTHYNPYTKLRYCDDPTLIFVEITNENSIKKYWRLNKLNYMHPDNTLPEHYSKQLDISWNNWLKEKYSSTTEVKKTWGVDYQTPKEKIILLKDKPFEENYTLENTINTEASSFNFSRPMYKFRNFLPKNLIIDMENFYGYLEGNYIKEMVGFLKQTVKVRVPIEGSQYLEHPALESCDFFDKHIYWDHPELTNDSRNFKIKNDSMLLNPKLGILEEIINETKNLSKPFTITEWNQCYPNAYAYETPPFLASQVNKLQIDAVFQFCFSGGWKNSIPFDNINGHFSIIGNSQQLIVCSMGSYIANLNDSLETEIKDGVFKINSSKIKGIVGFIKDRTFDFGNITFEAKQNGAVFLVSTENKDISDSNTLLLIVISEIKNTGSGWDKKGSFGWGTAPTLLKKLDVTVKISSGKQLKLYELWPDGTPKDTNLIEKKNDIFTFSTKNYLSPWFEITKQN